MSSGEEFAEIVSAMTHDERAQLLREAYRIIPRAAGIKKAPISDTPTKLNGYRSQPPRRTAQNRAREAGTIVPPPARKVKE